MTVERKWNGNSLFLTSTVMCKANTAALYNGVVKSWTMPNQKHQIVLWQHMLMNTKIKFYHIYCITHQLNVYGKLGSLFYMFLGWWLSYGKISQNLKQSDGRRVQFLCRMVFHSNRPKRRTYWLHRDGPVPHQSIFSKKSLPFLTNLSRS